MGSFAIMDDITIPKHKMVATVMLATAMITTTHSC
jgi:hypothetical protein